MVGCRTASTAAAAVGARSRKRTRNSHLVLHQLRHGSRGVAHAPMQQPGASASKQHRRWVQRGRCGAARCDRGVVAWLLRGGEELQRGLGLMPADAPGQRGKEGDEGPGE